MSMLDFLDALDGLGMSGLFGPNLGIAKNEPFIINHDAKAIEAHEKNHPIQFITEDQLKRGDFDITKPVFIELECEHFSRRRLK